MTRRRIFEPHGLGGQRNLRYRETCPSPRRGGRLAAAAAGLIVLLSAVHACGPADPPADGDGSAAAPQVASPATEWQVGDPAAAGFDSVALAELTEALEAGEFPNTHALLIEHDGVLIYEEYFAGTDERWGDPLGEIEFGPEVLHDERSVSKSVTSGLLGIALEAHGYDLANAVQRPVVHYLPGIELAPAKQSITLHHMLTMTPGLEWNEMDVPYTNDTNDELRTYTASDPARWVLERPLVHEPGSTWYYSGGTTQVLASVVRELTGRRLDEYAREVLFEPLGIDEFEWLGPGSWTPDEPAAMSGLRLRPRDLAKIGSVYLHEGRWRGRQIVPADWVQMSMTRWVPELRSDWSAGGTRGYGYQWWVGEQPTGERWAAGRGNGNQRLYVFRDERLVVTINAGEYNRSEGHSERLVQAVLAARRDESDAR